MGSPSVPDVPAAPEPVKKTDEEVTKARDTARDEAIRRFGVIGTDKTKNTLGAASTKQATLGA